MDKLDSLVLEARELLAEMDVILTTLATGTASEPAFETEEPVDKSAGDCS